jgi:hypothetical protein
MDRVSEKYLITDTDFERYHKYISSAKDLLLEEQKKAIT